MGGPLSGAAGTRLALALVLGAAAGCAVRRPAPEPPPAPFRFGADTFAFANETVWEYRVDAASGEVRWSKREPRPPFSLRCGTMARAARQLWAGARFDPTAPRADPAAYTRLLRTVLDGDPRRRPTSVVTIPGFADLHALSAAHPDAVQAALAGPWQSYVQRGNWRMIFPFPPAAQAREAAWLGDLLARGWPPIVHVLRYPRLTINHLLLVYASEETPAEIRFLAYDPNDDAAPVVLTWDRTARAFALSATRYFPGGPVKAYAVYDGLLD